MNTTTHIAGEALKLGPGGRSLRAVLFERIIERIHRYFVKLIWDPHAVDDCLQKTLLRLETSLAQSCYDPEQSFNRWMWLKAHSVYVDYCRERRMPAGLPEGIEDRRGDPTARVDAKLDAGTVLERLRRDLDPEAFEVFVLRHEGGQNLTQIAALVGRDRKTVRKHLKLAERAALRLLKGSVA